MDVDPRRTPGPNGIRVRWVAAGLGHERDFVALRQTEQGGMRSLRTSAPGMGGRRLGRDQEHSQPALFRTLGTVRAVPWRLIPDGQCRKPL